MRKDLEGIALTLVAVLLTSISARATPPATAPSVQPVPDIRQEMSGSGVAGYPILDLDDYVIDTSDRDADGAQDNSTLTWSEHSTLGDDNVSVTANELQVGVPAVVLPEAGTTTLRVVDTEANEIFTAITVKTVDSLLSGPLVDDFLVAGGTANSNVPYSWCISEGDTLRIQPIAQSGAGGGRLFLSATTGGVSSRFYAADTVVDATEQIFPLTPYEANAELRGAHTGTLGLATLETLNLSVDASLNGLFVTAGGGFADWARLTVARTYDSGARDSYSVAVADALEGTTMDLVGDAGVSSPTKIDADSNYGFEDLTILELLGAPSELAFEIDVHAARLAQETAWEVSVFAQAGGFIPPGFSLPNIDFTTEGKLAPTYPGATDGRAMKLTFDAPDGQGICFSHKGIASAEYAPGDVLTFSMNLYVDLNYVEGNADEINEASNGMVVAMGLTAQPLGNSGAFNYILFPPTQATMATLDLPGNATDYGQHARPNLLSILHGHWTRHEVSYRVPEFGQTVTGPGGTGDYIDPNGVSPKFVIGRTDTGLESLEQTIWVDNIAITKCPGALCMAQGATNCPMVSAGWAPEWSGSGSSGTTILNLRAPLPGSLARGAEINGNFSTGASTAAVAPIPATFPGGRMIENAASGWYDSLAQSLRAYSPWPGSSPLPSSLVYIAEGAANVALGFPVGFNQSLAFSPDPLAVGTNLIPVHDTTISGASAEDAGFQGKGFATTPLLDMRLASNALNPGLRVNDVVFAGGTGGRFTPNGIRGNVSGVFGVRFFARTNGQSPADNPQLNVILKNGDLSNGLVGQYPPQVLPNGADALGSGIVWSDNQFSGTVLSFSSAGRTDSLAHYRTGEENAALATSVAEDNPGSQLALVAIETSNPGNQRTAAIITAFLNGFDDVLGNLPPDQGLNPTGAVLDALPGRWGTATVYVDEVGLYAVRDINAFYDEDLSFMGLP